MNSQYLALILLFIEIVPVYNCESVSNSSIVILPDNVTINDTSKLLETKNGSRINIKVSKIVEDSELEVPVAREKPASPNGFKVFQMMFMMMYMVGPSAAKFINYKNYCGYNGDNGGRTRQELPPPADECDHCCEIHDDCYAAIDKTHGSVCNPYFTPYIYTMEKKLECWDSRGSCLWDVCKCDVNLVECIKEKHKEKEIC